MCKDWFFCILKDPLITSIHPNYAAMSGGREINFIGKNLNIGNGASISINNKTCIVMRYQIKTANLKILFLNYHACLIVR